MQEATQVKSFVREFKEFIDKGNLLAIAVAFVLGLAFKAVIDAFMKGIINPIIGLIFGKPNLDDVLTFTVHKGASNQTVISIGVVLTQIISLIIVGLVMFMLVKAYNKARGPQPDPGPDEIALLTDIRDELRARR